MIILLTVSTLLGAAGVGYLLARCQSAEHLVARQDGTLAELKTELRDWQDKTLAKHSMTPLGEEREERTPSGLAATSDAFDLRPPFARKYEEWDREEEDALSQTLPNLPPELQDDLLDGAREVSV